jgi:large subunit ribosomal protein L19
MADLVKALEDKMEKTEHPRLHPGDTVRVHVRIVEGSRERIQVFNGIVIRMHGGGINTMFTVRRIVERTFPLYSPRVEQIEVVRHAKVRRAQLYYMRQRSGKAARLKERRFQ